jgi:hypothetical protein
MSNAIMLAALNHLSLWSGPCPTPVEMGRPSAADIDTHEHGPDRRILPHDT